MLDNKTATYFYRNHITTHIYTSFLEAESSHNLPSEKNNNRNITLHHKSTVPISVFSMLVKFIMGKSEHFLDNLPTSNTETQTE